MSITYEAGAAGGGPSGSFSVTLPPTQDDDLIILDIFHRASEESPTLGGTFGETPTKKYVQSINGGSWKGITYYARATDDHDGETITSSDLAASSGAVTVYRGALASGDPLADATIVGEDNSSGDNAQAQITTSTDGAFVVLVVGRGGQTISSQSATDPSTLTERVESTVRSDARITHASAVKATAGATGAFSWSMSFDILNGSWAYAITPAGSTAPASPLVNDSSLTKSHLLHTPLVRRIRSGLLVPDRRLVIPQITPAGA